MIFGGQDNSGTNAGKDKVVTMDRFRSRSSLSPLRQAEAYWTALRRGDEIPSRSQVDPRGLENILSQTFILERVAPGIARFRLAGQKVNELAGMEVRGMPLTAFFTIEARKTVSAALEQMFEHPSIIELELKSEATRIRGSRAARMIILPLRSDLGDVSRALGVFVSEGTSAARVSQRFSVVDCDIRPVGANKETSKPVESKPKAPFKAPKVTEPTAGFEEKRPAFERKTTSLMDEARSLLDRARRENADAMRGTKGKEAAPKLQSIDNINPEDLVSRAPRNGKLDKGAPHLRLVVSRD